jgi:hypothetical protein
MLILSYHGRKFALDIDMRGYHRTEFIHGVIITITHIIFISISIAVVTVVIVV